MKNEMYRTIACLVLALAGVAGAQTTSGNRLNFHGRFPSRANSSPEGTPNTTGPSWSLHFPTFPDLYSLPYLAYHSSVYDPGSNRLISFGGTNENNLVEGGTWVLTDANLNAGGLGGQFSQMATASYPVPPPRNRHTAVYDSANNRMIIFGGCADAWCFDPLNDTWVLTNANGLGGTPTWTQLSPSGPLPNPRSEHEAIYDPANNRMIVFGGYGQSLLFDAWVLTNANGLGGAPAWIQLTPTGGPPESLDQASAVYDPTNNIATFFGGDCFNSVWTFSNANGLGGTPAWTNLIPNGASGSPACRYGHTAVYDAGSNHMIIYGGQSNVALINSAGSPTVAYGDVWMLANANGLGGSATWTQLHPKGYTPVGRFNHSAFYDAATNRMGIFGGYSIEGAFTSTWVLLHANGL